MGAAIDYLTEIGMEAIEEHEHAVAAYALERLAEVQEVHVFGPPAERRAGIVAFDVEGVHPHDVAQILDWESVAIRAGHHCCQPLMARLGVATNRASFCPCTIPEEIDRLVEGWHRVKKTLGNGASPTRGPVREEPADDLHHRRALHRHQRPLLRRRLSRRLHP
jgi:cysteine desulfurase/selenocysteine lyase